MGRKSLVVQLRTPQWNVAFSFSARQRPGMRIGAQLEPRRPPGTDRAKIQSSERYPHLAGCMSFYNSARAIFPVSERCLPNELLFW